MAKLDLNQVGYFVEVVRCGSFASAARALGVPPNTLSRQVQQLEERLSCRLLHRSTRKLTLTAAGQSLVDSCGAAVEKIHRASKSLVADSGRLSGHIRVAAPADFLSQGNAHWILEFLNEFPQISLEFVLSDAPSDLGDERIDLAFRAIPIDDARTILYRRFAHHFLLVASPEYLSTRGTPTLPSDLRTLDCMAQGSGRGTPSASWGLDGPDGRVNVDIDPRFIANTFGGLLQGALSHFGVAMLPAMLAAPHLDSGALVRVLPEFHRETDGLQLVLPSRRQIPPAVAAFAEFASVRLTRDWPAKIPVQTPILG
jgi:DNA-binding transcriptional LysR family regulator